MNEYEHAQADFAMNGMRTFRELLVETAEKRPGGWNEVLSMREIVQLIDSAFASVGCDPR